MLDRLQNNLTGSLSGRNGGGFAGKMAISVRTRKPTRSLPDPQHAKRFHRRDCWMHAGRAWLPDRSRWLSEPNGAAGLVEVHFRLIADVSRNGSAVSHLGTTVCSTSSRLKCQADDSKGEGIAIGRRGRSETDWPIRKGLREQEQDTSTVRSTTWIGMNAHAEVLQVQGCFFHLTLFFLLFLRSLLVYF